MNKIKKLFFELKKNYLIFPITNGTELAKVNLIIDDKSLREFDIELAVNKGQINFWSFLDISIYNGKTAEIQIDCEIEKSPILISQTNKIPNTESFYKESFPKIITVARLDKRKGHDKILMLIKNLKVRYPKVKYISIGHGEEENNLIKLRKELSLEKEVTFLKNIEENLKIALIAESDLFLMPTRIEKKSVEGFGISFIEAATYGVASIGGKDGGASDAINHTKTGLICDGNDLNSIYESVIQFIENEKFIELGQAAKKFSENFYWDKVVKKYLESSQESLFYLDPHVCVRCHYRSTELLWQCPQCHEWGTFVEERLSPGKDPETSNETVNDPEKPTKDSVVI